MLEALAVDGTVAATLGTIGTALTAIAIYFTRGSLGKMAKSRDEAAELVSVPGLAARVKVLEDRAELEDRDADVEARVEAELAKRREAESDEPSSPSSARMTRPLKMGSR